MNRKKMLLLLVLVVLFTPLVYAQTETSVVVPNSLTNVEGDTQSGLVFDCAPSRDSMRYQQVYLNSQITGAPVEIVGINFRPTEDITGIMPMVIPQLQIDMSVTQTQPDDLVVTFADNLGPIVTTVYDGPLTVAFPTCGTGPCPFDVKIPLQTPFIYDPNQGNLIIDIRVPECVNLGFASMDGTDDFETDSSKVFTEINSGVDDPEGDPNFLNDGGFVTQFDMIFLPRNVPTLSEWGLIAMAGILGIVGFIVIRRRKAAA